MQEEISENLKLRLGSENFEKRIHKQTLHTALRFKGGFRVYWENMDFAVSILEFILRATRLYRLGIKNSLDCQIKNISHSFINLPQSFDGYKILHLSDLHIDGLFDHGKKIISLLENISHYDACFITGDFRFLTYGQHRETMLYMSKILNKLDDSKPIYGILGNHDCIEMVPELESCGLKMLLNESVQIKKKNESISLIGIDDPHFYQTHDLQKACEKTPEDSFKILLSHAQESIAEADAKNIDFFLCGHTHGGQICLPGGIPLVRNTTFKQKKYLGGSWTYNRMKGYTSNGCGSSGLPVRFFAHPEITIHTLHKEYK